MAVRRESVRLELEDNFSKKMLAAAAATQALQSSLSDLDGTSVSTGRSLDRTSKDTDRLSRSAVEGSAAIDKYSGRLGIILKVAGALGPALVPIGAVGVAGVAALSVQLGYAAVGLSSVLIAFQGVGDALKTVNEAHLEPTVENLQKARDALEGLDPAAQAFVSRFQAFRPVLADLRNSAAAGFFPGMIEALDSFEQVAPRLGTVLEAVGSVAGNLIADGADALAGPEWGEFIDFIAREAPPALDAMGRSIGNVVQGLAHLTMAFDPVSDDMSSWLLNSSRGFERWADGLSKTEGFQEFLAYVRENGPVVGDAFVAIANAVLQIVEAAAPLGGPVLQAVTHLAEAIATIMDSPLGTPLMAAVTALSAYSLAANVATAATTRLAAAQAALGGGGAAKGGAQAAALGGGAKGGLVTATAVLGTIMGTNLIDNFVQVLQGDRGLEEATKAVHTWSNPVAAAFATFGVDVYGVDKQLAPFAANIIETARAQAVLNNEMGETKLDEIADGYGDIDAVLGRTQRAMRETTREQARAEAQAEALATALEEQAAQVQATADQWTDYSQKVELGTTSVDELMNRWDQLGTASANMANNIREAIRDGLDPKIIKDVIDTLGPQGAALALEQFANASGREASRIERSFRRMSSGVHDFEGAYDGLAGLVSGNGLSMGVQRQSAEIVTAAAAARRAIEAIPTSHSTNIKESGAAELAAAAARARAAVTSIPTLWTTTIRTVRIGGDTAGGPPEIRGGADGMTVPGRRRPYGDSVLAYIAPGEEVISNRYGQADRHRQLLKAINANRYADGGTMRSERPAGSSSRVMVNIKADDFRGSISTPWGTLDLRSAIRAEAQDVYDQSDNFKRTQR